MKDGYTDQVVEDFARRVRDRLGTKVRSIYWFGSRARGESLPESDYDLLIETVEPLNEEERARVVDVTVEVSGHLHIPFDVHYATVARMNRDAPLWSPFREAVVSEGIRF